MTKNKYDKCPKCGIMAQLVPKYDNDQLSHTKTQICRKCKRFYYNYEVPRKEAKEVYIKKSLTPDEQIKKLEKEIQRDSE